MTQGTRDYAKNMYKEQQRQARVQNRPVSSAKPAKTGFLSQLRFFSLLACLAGAIAVGLYYTQTRHATHQYMGQQQHYPASQIVEKPKFEFYRVLRHAKEGKSEKYVKLNVRTHQTKSIAQFTKQHHPAAPLQSTSQKGAKHLAPVVSAKAIDFRQPHPPTFIKKSALPTLTAKSTPYLIQVAAFKQRKDAERMKATLILKGFNPRIAHHYVSGVRWYRVQLGPFATHAKALTNLKVVKRKHFNGIVRRA